jgi:threonine synthase
MNLRRQMSKPDTDKMICSKCNKKYSLDSKIWRCSCNGLLNIEFKPEFPIDQISLRKPTMWRYREAIPIKEDKNIISLDEGLTPLTKVDFNGRSVLIKQDYLFPTGSFKDRGASVLISKIKELGINKVVEDSSGNAGCAIAAYCAKAKIRCEIFVPKNTAQGKLTQIRLYGAILHTIEGSREATAQATLDAAQKNYYASHYWNPFFLHGTKTFAFEVCEQLGWQPPDTVILPVGNGSLLLGVYIGFNELFSARIIEKMPKIIGVQSINCAPIAEAFRKNLKEIPEINKRETIAEGIAIAEPIRGRQILEVVKQTGGDFITVDDAEIKRALKETCEKGYYIEPTSAATIAGIKKYLKKSEPSEMIISTFTGHGLKTAEKMSKTL